MTGPRIRRQHGFWCVFRTPASPRPVIIGHDFARVCKGARRMFPAGCVARRPKDVASSPSNR